MWPASQTQAALALHADGRNVSEISRELGVPRTTVRDWIKPRYVPKRSILRPCPACGAEQHDFAVLPRAAYSYLLGMYLGDGAVSKAASKGCFRLRIVLDAKYPAIVEECREAMQAVLPDNRIAVAAHRTSAAFVVSAYSKQWPCLLPQHGEGRKHHRPIVLTDWQLRHTASDPEHFLRGLIHSDGCRSLNSVQSKNGRRTYRYARYLFSNRSEDIRSIYTFHLNLLGVEWRPMGRWNVSVARRASVAELDRFVGPKR